MTYADMPDPSRIESLDDLVQAFGKLRRRAARTGQVQLSVRDIANRTGRASSTLDQYLRGKRLCPVDVYEDLLRALEIGNDQLRPWLDAWERIADSRPPRSATRPLPATTSHTGTGVDPPVPAPSGQPGRRSDILPYSETFLYRVLRQKRGSAGTVGIVTGDLRRVTCADIWVNSENTDMRMSRFEEYSVSAVIRFGGAVHDDAGQVVEDLVANELAGKVAGRGPVAAGTAIATGAGELSVRNGVRYIIHVAAVSGEPGEGYRQVLDIGRCVTNALVEAERLATVDAVQSILFPLLGTGVAGGDPEPTARAILGAAIDHFLGRRQGRLRTIYLLASTATERDICRTVLDTNPRLVAAARRADYGAATPRPGPSRG